MSMAFSNAGTEIQVALNTQDCDVAMHIQGDYHASSSSSVWAGARANVGLLQGSMPVAMIFTLQRKILL